MSELTPSSHVPLCNGVGDVQSRSLGFARTMDLKYALGDELGGDELEETGPYTQWPRLLRQILGASVLVSCCGCLRGRGGRHASRVFCIMQRLVGRELIV